MLAVKKTPCDHWWNVNVNMRMCQLCSRLECNENYGTGRRPRWVRAQHWDEKKGPPSVGSICHDCAIKAGAKCPPHMVVTMWHAECGVCHKPKTCCSPRDYNWPDGTKAIFD